MNAQGRPCILLVDDDPFVRRFVAHVLVGAGYDVFEAENGERALEMSTGLDRAVDLLVTDFQMPGMTGWELAERLRSKRPDLGVLVLSGDRAEVRRGAGAGADFVEKPFTSGTLLARVRGLREARAS